MPSYLYVPVIKGKENDCRAVAELSTSSRPRTKPLLELLPFALNKTVDQQLVEFNRRVARMASGGPIFVDPYGANPGQTTSIGQLAVLASFNAIAQFELPVTPVFGLNRDNGVWPGLSDVVARLNQGFCFRIDWEDLDDEAEHTWAEIIERTAQLGLRPSDVDFLIDLRSLNEGNVSKLEEAVLDFVAQRPALYRPRSITLAGSCALKEVGSVPKHGHAAIIREELRLWVRLAADLIDSTKLGFADYGVIHPDFAPTGPAPHANAKIRYTSGTAIHYFRGCAKSEVPLRVQYPVLATRVVNSDFYAGPSFSVGDQFIADCAGRPPGPGNGSLGTWVWVDQNHHIELTVRQLEKLVPQISAAASSAAAEKLLTD